MRRLFAVVFILLIMPVSAAVYGPTTSVDQLWQIAILARPSAQVSVQQMMVAIFHANPKAFKAGNMNNLKSGVTLQLPSLGSVQKVKLEDAQKFLPMGSRKTRSTRVVKKIAKTKYNNISQQLNILQQNFDKVGKILISFDQQYQTRLTDIRKKDLLQQAKIVELNKEISDLKNIVSNIKKPEKLNYISYLQILSNKLTTIWAYFVAALVFIIMWLFSFAYRRKTEQRNIQIDEEEVDVRDEYDFLGSEEGIPAKLDLARAYIDMGDNGTARAVLEEIIQKGDEKQKEQARNLLKKCE